MFENFNYDIHSIITVSSEVILPELEPFRAMQRFENPTIRVAIGHPSKRSEAENKPGERHLFYKEIFGLLGFAAEINIGERVNIVASPLLRYSPHVLYTNLVEPVLRWSFVERGYALVHGATIAFGDQAYMITARTDTDKTTTLLKILNHQRRYTDNASFISDDMTLVSPDGLAMTYPKPMTISHHTVQAVNSAVLTRKERLVLLYQSRIHSRSGRKVAFFLGKTKLPMASINAVVQFLVPPPKYNVQRLVPRVKLARTAKLAGLFIIERGKEEMDRPLDQSEAIEILLANCEDAYGFPPYEDIKEFLYKPNGTDLRPIEQGIIRSALGDLPANLIRSSHLEWWRRIPAFVDEVIADDFVDHSQLAYDTLEQDVVQA
jgi:dolichol-phosphate mannosyltransferase